MSLPHAPRQEESKQLSRRDEASDYRFLAVIQASADVFCILAPSGQMQVSCPAWQAFTGQIERDTLGMGWLDAFHQADRLLIEEILFQAVTTGRPAETQCHLRRHDGSYRLLRVQAIPVRAADGAIREVVVSGTDSPGRKPSGQMSEVQMQLAVNALGVGMWDWDLVTNQFVWTDQEKMLFGWPPDTPVSYERFLAALHPADREHIEGTLTGLLAEQQEHCVDYRVIWSDGSIHWLSDRAQSITDAFGRLVHIVGVTIDITSLKQTEEHLWATNRQVTAMLESITDAFMHLDREWRYTYINERMKEVIDKSGEELQGQQIWEAVPGLSGTVFEQHYRAAMEMGQERHFEAHHPTRQRWLDVHVYPGRDGISVYMQDISERKQAEEALQQSREELHILTETMPQLVWVTQPDGFASYYNQRWYKYTGATAEQHMGDQWIEALHPDDQQKTWAIWRTALQTGQLYEIEYRLREGKTGDYHWFLARALPLIDDQGRLLKWFGTCTDIDEKKRTEEALRESEVRFRRLVDSNIIGITVADLRGHYYEANDAFLSLLGYTQEDLAEQRMQWTTMTPPEYWEKESQATREILTVGVFQPYEKEFWARDGRRVPVLIGGALFRQGPPPLVLSFILDLTTRKEMEQQKDLFLSMTSHELKTPLAALKGTFQLIQRRARRIGTWSDHLSPEARIFLEDLAERMAASARQVDIQTHLINDLLDVSRITSNTLKLERRHFDLVAVVRETIEDLRVTAPERSLLLELPQHTTVEVHADRDRISQVVTNYVTNALRYSSPTQPVSIGLTVQESSARVWVRDKGPGLTEEAQAELWQRFHQVKSIQAQSGSGKGLGLGLYICRTLIAQHQGEVGVESTPGEGSTFWFTLPIL